MIMRSIAKISPSIKLTARLSFNTNVRRYTSLVQVQQKPFKDKQQLWSDLAMRRFYGTNVSDMTSRSSIKSDLFYINSENCCNSILSIALIDLNPIRNNSSKVLLIPLNWRDADENAMRTTITSIFSKPKNLQQIEAISQALKDVPVYKKTKENVASKSKGIQKKKESNTLNYSPKEQLNLKDAQLSENKQVLNTSFDGYTDDSPGHLELLASAVERSVQQCCLHSMQMFVDDILLGKRIEGLKVLTKPLKFTTRSLMNDVDLIDPFSTKNIMKIDACKLNLKDITWNSKIPLPDNQISTLTNIMFPLSYSKKSYSTRTINLLQQKALTEDRGLDSKMLTTLPTSSPHKGLTLTTRRKASSSSVPSKCNPNYDFPYLSKLFGTKELLMSCDAYNKALIEAEKRRAALAKCTALSKQMLKNTSSRPQVTSIKGCCDPKRGEKLQTLIKTSSPCPPPVKVEKQASNGCKKDDPCKPPECPSPCKDEMEKLKRLEKEEMKKKRNKSPTGCVSPKCKKEDGCTKFRKSPCKKATKQITNEESKCSSKAPEKEIKMADSCKKDDPCKPPKCPNPCKDEMEKLQRLKDEEARKNVNKIPSGCVSPKCEKEDTCTKRKENPCKKAGASDSRASVKCNKKGGDTKGKSDSCGKSQEKKQKYPCLDDHADYKPKCNIDPCKQGGSPCSGGAKKSPVGPSPKKKADSCGGEKKEDPCEKYNIKKNPCKMKDICGGNKQKDDPCKKKESSPCGSKEEDPCKKRKSSPCGSRKEDPCKKQKEDSCTKKRDSSKSPCGSKNDDPCKKQKDDPCKKKKEPAKSPCSSKKEDPCKKSKDDPCKQKNNSGKSPCSSKKEDPCKKSKDDPCKKKKSSPCVSDKNKDDTYKKKPTSPCKPKKDSKTKCQKSSASKKKVCGKQKKETKPNCGQNKKSFCTSAETNNNSSSVIKRTFANFTAMPCIRNKNWLKKDFTRYYSSKRGGNKKTPNDLGRASQCKSVETKVPPKRKPAFNPHPKDGLRKCYPTYDMDCQQFCKDPRKTDCRKYAFLKDTDNNKRNGKK